MAQVIGGAIDGDPTNTYSVVRQNRPHIVGTTLALGSMVYLRQPRTMVLWAPREEFLGGDGGGKAKVPTTGQIWPRST